MKGLKTDINELPCYPGVCYSLSIKQDLEGIPDHNSSPNDLAGHQYSTPVHAGTDHPKNYVCSQFST